MKHFFKFIFKYFLIFTLLLSGTNSFAQEKKPLLPTEFWALVIGVKDGDTVEVLYDKKPIIIRLEHIDCPEKKQPYGTVAKKFTSDFIFGMLARIVSNGKYDRYGRLIAVIYNAGKINLNKALVENGLALHYIKYSKDASYGDLEARAKKNKSGIWSQPTVTEPWVYRKRKKKVAN